VDIFCASQNLLQGVIKDPDLSSAEVGIEDAISTASELLFYMEPLSEDEWAAPAHPFLLAEQGEPAAGWMRRGPAALTRAWCIFELAKSLSKKCTLHVLLSETSVAQFEDKMLDDDSGFEWIGRILGNVDVKQAQITKTDDRAYILGEVGKLPGALGAINSNVMAALHGWVIGEAQALLAALPEAERGTSLLLNNVVVMLAEQGRLAEAEALYRVALAAWRAEDGDRAPNTLAALGNLAESLRQQGKLAEAEPLFRESLAAEREVEGNDDDSTMKDAGNLGTVLLAQGKLAEAEPLLVEAVAWWRKNNSLAPTFASLVELREQGRLDEAEQELGTLVADARELWGPQDLDTLEAEAVAARLRHAQPDGAAAGAAELRDVVERMTEFLGAAHHYTVKWQGVLEGMS
jgi:tetratricopeptide (TPR) repeat protein